MANGCSRPTTTPSLITSGSSIWPRRRSKESAPGFSFPGRVGGAMGVSTKSRAGFEAGNSLRQKNFEGSRKLYFLFQMMGAL